MDHNKPYDRIDRVNNQILDILGDVLIKHIDLSHLGFVTFTKIDTTRDLRIAKVYYSVLNPTSCLLYTSPSPRDQRGSRMPSSA